MTIGQDINIEKIKPSLERCGAKFVLNSDKKYPERLKSLNDPPFYLFYKGNLDVIHGTKNIAIVGTRTATRYGLGVTKKISSMLAKTGVVIISGLAVGIDSSAHEGALNIGKTVAVLGTGIDNIYPVGNEKLAENILKEGGLIISEYPPNDEYKPWNFPQRNRIISILSDAVIVVEGDTQSGALITARFAIKQGKPLFAIPGPIDSPASNGPNLLLKSGVAELLTSINDVLEKIGKDTGKQTKLDLNDNNKELGDLSRIQKNIFEILSSQPKSFENLLQETELEVKDLVTNLSVLELKGFIEKTNDGGYARI